MNDFTFYCPTKFVFGKQAEQKTGQLCKESGASHVLLVTGGSSAQKSGLLQRIQDSLTESGLQVSSLSGVKPNPRVSLVREGIQMIPPRVSVSAHCMTETCGTTFSARRIPTE